MPLKLVETRLIDYILNTNIAIFSGKKFAIHTLVDNSAKIPSVNCQPRNSVHHLPVALRDLLDRHDVRRGAQVMHLVVTQKHLAYLVVRLPHGVI